MTRWSLAGRCVLVGAQRLALIAALCAAPVLAACEPGAGGAVVDDDVRAPQRHVIEIEGFAFRPQNVRIAVGDTVEWLNRDVVAHTATDSASRWDSGALQSGASWTLVAATAGVMTYVCTLHPTMKGQLIIE